MKIRYLLFGLFMFAILGEYSFGQVSKPSTPLAPVKKESTIYFGLSVGYNKVMHSADIKTFAYDVLCPVFSDGKSSGFHAGGFYEQMIGEIGTAHSVVVRGLYNTFPANFDQQGDKLLSRISGMKDDVAYERDEYTTTAHKNEIKYSALSLDLMYKFRAFQIQDVGGLVFTVGPTFDFIGTKTRSQVMSIVSPDNVQFVVQTLPAGQDYTPDFRGIIVFDGDIDNASSLRFGVKAGVQLEIKLPGTPFDIIPSAFYNFGFTDVDDQDWKVNVIQIGVDLRYALKL